MGLGSEFLAAKRRKNFRSFDLNLPRAYRRM